MTRPISPISCSTTSRVSCRRPAPAFRRHMALCPDCVQYLQDYTETIKASRLAMADELPEDVPDELVSAILKARDR